MRTREEQIAQLSRWLTQVFPEGSDEAKKQILEAERRAEQRVRAEIGRDSERLDWLERQSRATVTDRKSSRVLFHSPRIGPWDDIREAIDAARETE